ncbi:TPA: IncP plasmid survival protein KfrC family protein [Salmonella enterica subsp. enterica serovar Typhimurium]|uniref:IncP plasmid survival protein KfrC family protein n=1 Tax=Escherichia coli TaxID=562 RepID=UPI00066E2A0C|nr:IncP plasmid survival protein KfrC family protein [Escherichia coli]KMV54294.1 traN-like protein [Escherichia coli]
MKPVTPFQNPGQGRDTQAPRVQPDIKTDHTTDSDAANIQEQVQQLHDEQQQLADEHPQLQENNTDNVAQEYQDAVDAAIAEKETQAENLENRLESMIDKQETVLQQMMSKQPGFLSLPGQKAKWQSQVQQQQALLSRLQNRLETVKEIHDGMGLHGPKIHELATAKVRHDKPELAEGWDDMRAAHRAHENLMRKQAREQKEKLQRELSPSLSKGNGLSLTRTIT